MRLALLADLHANREATEACLSKLRKLGFDRAVLLGDIVGYGADPEWTVDEARRLVDDGGLAIYGNHDEAVLRDAHADAQSPKHAHAQAAIDWTRGRLSAAQRAFLAALPASIEDEDRLYVHANAWAPLQWGYIANALAAAQSIAATRQRLTFCGHVHEPALYHSQPDGGARHFAPTPGVAVPLLGSRRWLALPGSVGQPRDGNPAACCALYDTATTTLTTLRVAYDHHAAARKIVDAGLPESLAKRLVEGC
jgi:diadenosine tetraphosphatase ApaH/serine/threonine PP2A family protein phosphatase